MDNIIFYPPASLTSEHERLDKLPSWGRVPDGMVEWVAGIEKLDRKQHGFAVPDIKCVEAFWSFADIGFSSAGFVVKLADGRHFYLQCAIDEDNQPDMVAITVETLPAGQPLEIFQNACELPSGWSDEVDPFNVDLLRLQIEADD